MLYRIIKYVSRLLIDRTKVYENQQRLKQILLILDDVTFQACSFRDCLKVKLNYYQQEYASTLDYCKMFLSFSMPNEESGEYGIDYFLINMPDLFERFVAGYLERELGENAIVEPKKSIYLAQDWHGDIFKIENDILVTIHNKLYVVDVKYKVLNLGDRENKYGISQNDIYQMISYAIRRDTDQIVMIYPGHSSEGIAEGMRFSVMNELSDLAIEIRAVLLQMDTTDRSKLNGRLQNAFS